MIKSEDPFYTYFRDYPSVILVLILLSLLLDAYNWSRNRFPVDPESVFDQKGCQVFTSNLDQNDVSFRYVGDLKWLYNVSKSRPKRDQSRPTLGGGVKVVV